MESSVEAFEIPVVDLFGDDYDGCTENRVKGLVIHVEKCANPDHDNWIHLHSLNKSEYVSDASTDIRTGEDLKTTVGRNRIEIVSGNKSIQIAIGKDEVVGGDCSLEIVGASTETVGNGKNVNIGGELSTNVDGNHAVSITGNAHSATDGSLVESIGGNSTTTVGGDRAETTNGNRAGHTVGNRTDSTDGEHLIQANVVNVNSQQVLINRVVTPSDFNSTIVGEKYDITKVIAWLETWRADIENRLSSLEGKVNPVDLSALKGMVDDHELRIAALEQP